MGQSCNLIHLFVTHTHIMYISEMKKKSISQFHIVFFENFLILLWVMMMIWCFGWEDFFLSLSLSLFRQFVFILIRMKNITTWILNLNFFVFYEKQKKNWPDNIELRIVFLDYRSVADLIICSRWSWSLKMRKKIFWRFLPLDLDPMTQERKSEGNNQIRLHARPFLFYIFSGIFFFVVLISMISRKKTLIAFGCHHLFFFFWFVCQSAYVKSNLQ